MIYEVSIGEQTYRVELKRVESAWKCTVNGRELPVDVSSGEDGVLSLLLQGKSYEIKQETAGTETRVVVGQERFSVAVRDPRSYRARRHVDDAAQGIKKITAPMPGKVVRLLAGEGTAVQAGQSVIVIEAMKMQNELKSPKAGKVVRVSVAVGDAVGSGDVLAVVE
jgi:biotin carboxyl carrier protein